LDAGRWDFIDRLFPGVKSALLAAFAPGFALGVCLLQRAPELPAPGWVLLPALALLVTWRRFRAARWVAPVLLGLMWSWLHAWWALQGVFPAAMEGRELELTGRIRGLVEQIDNGRRFVVAVESAVQGSDPAAWRGRIRLSWRGAVPDLHSGDLWRLRVRLKAPHGFSNPGGFDYEGWLFSRGIGATGYVRSDPRNLRLAPGGWSLDRWREALRDRLRATPGDPAAVGLVVALTLGERSGVQRLDWEALTRTGTNHLVAISGLHVGILAGFAFFLTRLVWRRSARACQWLAAPRAAALAALATATGYAALAGFAVSTQRALVMLALVFGAVLLRRNLRPFNGLAAALVLVLLWDPFASLSAGFWLSFGAVAVLLFGMTRRPAAGGLVWRWARAQWLVALGLLPLLVLLFGRVSLVAPLVNLVAVPLFSLLLLPLVLAAAVVALMLGWYLPLEGVVWLLEQGLGLLAWVGAQPWAAWSFPQRPGWVWLPAFLGVLLLLAPRGLPGRWTGVPLLLPLLLWPVPRPEPGAFRLSLLDVGQGLAAVIQTHGHLLVYDTGPRYASGFNTGEAVVTPFLRARGLDRIDHLILSHADNDHAGGLSGLLSQIPALRISSGEPRELEAGSARQCLAAQAWEWDGVRFRILAPVLPLPRGGNERSCVLQVSNRAGALLLTGDAELGSERALVARHGNGLRSRVLVAGHHGSRTSTSPALLAAVRPEWVLYSAGYRNRYGFPRPEVRERVARAGADQGTTIRGGALELWFGADGRLGAPRAHREEAQRLWTHRPEF
jgi:competence protein ComEC